MIKKTLVVSLLSLGCSLPVVAGTMGDALSLPSYYVGAFGGYGTVDGGIEQDGNFSQARLTLGVRAPHAYKNLLLGGYFKCYSYV